MAKSLPIFFFLLLALVVDQSVGRESRMFSKMTRSDPTSVDTSKTPEAQEIINVESKEQQVGEVKEEEEEEEEATFLPQSSQNGSPYGLYGRPSGPEKEEQPQEASVKEEEEATRTAEPQSGNYLPSKNYAAELQGIGSENKQGMTTDTRFMDNGRYSYEKTPAYYSSGEYRSRNFERAPEYYNNRGYYSGNADAFGNYYNNNNPRPTRFHQPQQQDFEFYP